MCIEIIDDVKKTEHNIERKNGEDPIFRSSFINIIPLKTLKPRGPTLNKMTEIFPSYPESLRTYMLQIN